jgi:transcriptional regulator of arginine metabolism
VAARQTVDAKRYATSEETAPNPAYSPDQSAFRSMSGRLPCSGTAKPGIVPGVDAPLTKGDRQRLLAGLVERLPLGTQRDALDALAGAGCRVTQATVSRDLAELGVVKETDELGRTRYALPGRRGRDPRRALSELLGRHGRGATAAQNVVVLQCEIGTAPAIARALDRSRHPLVVGTLAGDDTCLVIAADAADAASLAAELGRGG